MRTPQATIAGLDVRLLLHDRGSRATVALARKLDGQATADGVAGTPTILVGRSGNALHPVTLAAPTDARSVSRAIDAALR